MKQPCEILRALREDADFDQSDVAKYLGISQQVYSSYERGQYELPSRHLAALAKFYHVNVEYLLGITDYKDSFEDLRHNFVGTVTVGGLLSHLLALDDDGRKAAIEYVDFLNAKRASGRQNPAVDAPK